MENTSKFGRKPGKALFTIFRRNEIMINGLQHSGPIPKYELTCIMFLYVAHRALSDTLTVSRGKSEISACAA